MSQYFVSITIQTDNKRWRPATNWFPDPGWITDHALDAGTYVEVETTGDVCDAGAPHSGPVTQEVQDIVALGHLDPDDALAPRCVFPVERTGRNLVLLAVAGEGQVFDHWEGKACAEQGARCEAPEPPEEADLYPLYDLTAVFKARPQQSHGAELDPGQVGRLSDTLPDPPQR